MSDAGLFITLEGGDGVGKTTQFELLVEHVRSLKRDVVAVHEPGGTRVGERVREVLLDDTLGEMDPLAELFLFEAARAQVAAEVIAPALAAGKVVVCDRFTDSTTVYQGIARGLGVETTRQLNAMAAGGCTPDCTVLLSMGARQAAERIAARNAGGRDRMEQAGDAFLERVHEGFLQLAEQEPQRFRIVDATGSPQEVHARVLAAVHGLAGLAAGGA